MIALAIAAFVAFQCPDGSPPPCRAALARPGNTALSDSTWLVFPFDNQARATDAELVRQASVSQLYSEMTRWRGIRVVPDDRLADLLQQLPAPQRERPGLEAARTLARRAGAGRIVLGGYLAAGGRASITAKAYDTRTGQELRVVRDPLAGFQSPAALDSLAASFGRVARGLLGVPEGSGEAAVGVGTSSIEAYRAYLSAVDALNHVQIDSALARFERALRIDPSFALAHVQLWRAATNPVSARMHLEAALRLSAGLPPRLRSLLEGMSAFRRGDQARTCEVANQLVGSDSADAEGWVLLSNCYNASTVVVEEGRPRLRGDLNRALRAAERASVLAPASLWTIQALADALDPVGGLQCVGNTGPCPPESNYVVALMPSGDSFTTVIAPWPEVRHARPDLSNPALELRLARFRRQEALIQRVMALSPDARFVHLVLAQTALLAGDVWVADTHFGAGTPTPFDTFFLTRSQYLRERMELALAIADVPVFQAFFDSLFARTTPGTLNQYRAMRGNFAEFGDTSEAGRQNAAWRPVLAGALPEGFEGIERTIAARLTGPPRDDFLQYSTLAAFHFRRAGPALDTASRHPLKRYQAWAARGDEVRARAALAEFDRELLARHERRPDDGGWLFSAESHLELGDTATAFARMQEFGRHWPFLVQNSTVLELAYFHTSTARLWGRAWMLYGDLAMARGASGQARNAYRMVVGLWERGDPPVQPMLARARAALTRLGS